MNDVVERLGQWLWKNCPAKLDQLAPGLTDEAITTYEQMLKVKLPEGMRALYRWRNGTLPHVKHADIIGRYQLLPLLRVVADQKMMNELREKGEFKTGNWWRATWVPVFDKGTGDLICWDPRGSFSGEPGQVLEFWHTDHDRRILAPSFDGFLTAYVESLEAGVWTYNEEEGFEDNGLFIDFLAKKFPGYPHTAIDFKGRPPKRPPPPPPAIDAAPGREVKPYSIATRFEVGDPVTHPQFGAGVVQSVEQTKAEILFSVGRRTLVHARGGGEKLAKPAPIDHTQSKRTKV